MDKANSIIEECVTQLLQRYPQLEEQRDNIINGYLLMAESYANGKKLLIAGNGGSYADAEHIVGELMKSFTLQRPIDSEMKSKLKSVDQDYGNVLQKNLQKPLPAIALGSQLSLDTAFANDVNAESLIAQQLYGYGTEGDTLLAISTSGNSENIVRAAVTAKAVGMKVLLLTGSARGKLVDYSDIIVHAPELETYKIQELHQPVYHCWCMALERYFFQ